ncbi:MAG TPA: DUF2178 domain-containing protein [Candidatus Paceibacterota bacterium]|nr:DUF2178 domain-containing protein [Candidatus Paceibacterota bacterium]HPT18324.1 DUF2178 domain-containing protein [Candidatus Paceibacterota bacterium]
MTNKQYKKIKLIIIVIIAIIFGQSIVLENYIIPIVTLIITSLVLLLLRRRVKDVISDERDMALGGKSALIAIQIYSWIAVIVMFVLYSFKDTNPFYEPIGMTLAYSTCLLMLIYSIVFRFYNKETFSKNKKKYIIFAIILAIFISFFSIRFFSGEDNWVCRDGQWIKHGNPDYQAPIVECK